MAAHRTYNFGAAHDALRRYVDADILPGASCAVLDGRDLVDVHCVGWADKERGIALGEDHLFRVFSNTKLVTSCAALLLFEEGRFRLDDPIERFIPQLADRRVLKVGATTIGEVEPAHGPITIRHLMSHSSGLSYGLLDPGSILFEAYSERKMLDPGTSLGDMIEALAGLPLAFHPGTGWEYSVATDVLARLIEVLSGERFDAFVRSRVLGPLGMADTSFVVPEEKRSRFTAYYVGADLADPMKPGLTRADDTPYPGAYLRPVAKLSGGGGMVSSLHDMVALLCGLLPGGKTLLEPGTIALMMSNHLAEGTWIRFPRWGEVKGKAYGLAGALTLAPSRIEPADAAGEFHWGGIGGTHWWISPKTNLAAVLMTHRHMSFWHPSSFEFKRLVYQAAGRR